MRILRVVAAVALLVVGFAAPLVARVDAKPSDVVPVVLAGLLCLVLEVAAFLILPGTLTRRVLGFTWGLGATVLWVGTLLAPAAKTAGVGAGIAAGLLAGGWIAAHHRRGPAYFVVLLPVVVGMTAGAVADSRVPEGAPLSGWGIVIVGAAGLVSVVVTAILSRLVARQVAAGSQAPSQEPVPVWQPVEGLTPARPPQTNTFAILALVFGILGGLLSIPFGFVALAQTRRTGETGRGFAIFGLVVGFFWLAVYLALLVAVIIYAANR